MKNLIKRISIILFFSLLQSCINLGPPQYQSQGKTADLLVDFPTQYQASSSIYVVEPDKSDIFGNKNMEVLTSPMDKNSIGQEPIKISTDHKLTLDIGYMASYSKVCDITITFLPVAGKHYRLSTRVTLDQDTSFIKAMIKGTDDECYVGVQEIKNDKLIPIHLTQS